MRYFIDRKSLKSVCHGIFATHLCYSSLVWAYKLNPVKRLFVLQKKSLKIIYFWSCNAVTFPFFKESNILKFPNKVALENCFFINKYFNNFLPTIFKNWVTLSSGFHTYNSRWSSLGCLVVTYAVPYMGETQSILVLSTYRIIYQN